MHVFGREGQEPPGWHCPDALVFSRSPPRSLIRDSPGDGCIPDGHR